MATTANTLIRLEYDVTDLDEDDFRLDLRVVEAAHPIAKLTCDTSDGCGQTCSGSACNSQANNPS
jgi:FxLD family lantipeptide